MLVQPTTNVAANIKVVGVGGGGCNAVNTMIADYNIDGVEFIAVNTDAQVLKNSRASLKLQIGSNLTSGLGAGGDPSIGQKAAEESVEEINQSLEGADMVFITGGMGGGTGTGAIPVISGIAKNLGALTVAVVTKPFTFENKKRMEVALEGISRLKDNVDAMIVIPNQRILDIIDKNLTFHDAMRKVDEVLANAVLSIANLVTQTGFINLDFADVRTILKNSGTAMMGIGVASGESRAEHAARQAITSPLLEMSIQGAKGLLFNIRGGSSLTMSEVAEAAELITNMVDTTAVVKIGATIDESLEDDLHVTVLAAGFPDMPIKMEQQIKPVTPAERFDDAPLMTSFSSDSSTPVATTVSQQDQDSDELDIPAFLRRK
ncbi:MAG: cell division protein FtsZ [Candidatus Dojkabacteria bacterium]|nr:MAG: cell division protein FtsZ [Candidatus Dojkabacteria bacterium]